jgi:hypothetical protein
MFSVLGLTPLIGVTKDLGTVFPITLVLVFHDSWFKG